MSLPIASNNRPLRILQLVSSPTTSGPCVYVLELSQMLRQLGHEMTIVARPDSWMAAESERLGFHTLVSDQYRFPFDQIQQLRHVIQERNIDLIHTHMSRAHSMGVLLRGLCQIPCVATAHCRKIQAHWALNNHVIATSLDTERFHRRYNLVPRDRISTIYSPVPRRLTSGAPAPIQDANAIQELRSRWGCRQKNSSSETVVGVVGEISPAKGQAYLLQAIRHLHTAGREIRLVVIGNHREDYVVELQKLARDLGIGSRIHWAGFCNQVPLAMLALDMYVCPSLSESLPLTLLEAMSAARPIVATQVGGIPEIIRHRATGLLVPPRNSMAIAQAMAEIIDNPEQAQRLGQQAWQKIQSEFDPLEQSRKIEALYYRFVPESNANTTQQHAA